MNLETAINARRIHYQTDPIGFETDVLDVKPLHVWSKMREVAESVRDNQLTAVPACHSVSKTFGAARIAVWFKTCFQPSTVITTAPSDNQVKNQLWKEIHTAYSSSQIPLGGKMTTLQWNMRPTDKTLEGIPRSERGNWEKNFAIGFATSPDSATEHATKMQGWHNKYLLVILDEASGIMLPIWKTILEGLIINERCKVLAIGNPTDPYCKFAAVCKSSRWNVIKISVRDTPNYIQDVEVIPNVAGRQFERDIIDEYGENSNEHKIRCLGEFPTFMEGTIWGPEIGELEKKGHYGDFPWDSTAPVYVIGDYGPIYTAIGFFQYIQSTIRMVDYFYDDIGMGVPGMCKMLDSKPYNYAKEHGFWLSPDYDPKSGSNRKSLATGTTILSEFSRLGYHFEICDPHPFIDGINTVRGGIPLLRIDKRCTDFLDSVKQYRYKKNLLMSTTKKPAYSKSPQETPATHPADMLRYQFWIYRYQLVISDERIGYPEPIAANAGMYGDDNPIYSIGGNPINYR